MKMMLLLQTSCPRTEGFIILRCYEIEVPSKLVYPHVSIQLVQALCVRCPYIIIIDAVVQ